MAESAASLLPPEIRVLERGWLSSNNVVLLGAGGAAIVDTGYWTHSDQTLALVRRAISDLPLEVIANTHLHSDHCGGNAALQAHFPQVRTLIPPGLSAAVQHWDEVALTYTPTGQTCPRFHHEGLLQPGTSVDLGDQSWQVHAAPGHDPHSVVLFEPGERILLSADALWENGFGIVFPELEGEAAFEEVADTLDLIEELRPRVVVPGHGAVFTSVGEAIARARSRLKAYVADPRRHGTHAAKVLLKFKLLELQDVPKAEFLGWAVGTPYLRMVYDRIRPDVDVESWIDRLLVDLASSGALVSQAGVLRNV